MENHAPPYPIQSVDYALQLLLILKRDGVLRVSEAAAELRVARSTAHRLISMLRFRGFASRPATAPTGPAARSPTWPAVPSSATALLRHRPAAPGPADREDRGDQQPGHPGRADVQFIDSIESRRRCGWAAGSGSGLAARLTSGGKVLLADLPFEEVALLHPELADDEAGLSALKRMLR